MLRIQVLVSLFVTVLCASVRADGLLIVHDAPDRRDHFAFAPLEVSYHRVDVKIDDAVATTRVDQAFYNPTGRRLEGTYIFPLPQGASIDKFSMDIDGEMTQAELLDASRARSIYEEIVRKYRDPALMEYVGRGAMKVRVFPIEPNSTKRIQLSYTQVLKSDSGITEYLYPLNTEKFSAKPLKDVSVRVQLTSSTPIRSIYCPTHDVEVRRDGARAATVGFEAKNVRPDIDFKLMVSKDPDPVGLSLLSYRDGSEGYFMLLASPGNEASPGQIQAKDICFVLDTSGSMAGAKMEQAKKAINFCLANLNREDRFEVIRFATDAQPLFGKLEEATRENVDRATAFVDQLKAIGGTAIEDALKRTQAVSENRTDGRPYMVVFLTDGLPTLGATNPDQLVSLAKSLGGARVFSFGIGADVNTALLDQMANETRAVSQYVLPSEDIEVKVSSFYTKIQSPVLTNVKLEFTNTEVRVTQLYPADLPDLFNGETLVLFGRYEGEGDARVRLTGTLNGQASTFSTSATFSRRDTSHGFIPRLWATRRVGWLLDEIRLRGESREVKDEITQLAREHGIVTPYTAYLIVEDERRRNVRAEARTLSEIADDREMQLRMQRAYESVSRDSGVRADTGNQALDNSLALNTLKESTNGQHAQQSQGMARGGRGASVGGGGANLFGNVGMAPATQPMDGYKVARNYAQQVKIVNNRAFYQNGSVWTDNTIQNQQNLKRQEIKFNSDEYYALMGRYPAAIPWLSLGAEVDVVIEDTVYMVR